MSLIPTCRCGHPLLEHERIAHAHEWACHGPAAEGTKPCDCDGCQEEGAPARCACRSFRPLETERPERPAEATT